MREIIGLVRLVHRQPPDRCRNGLRNIVWGYG